MELRSKIQPISIRRLKDNVLELPEKIFQTILVELSPEQNKIYKKLKKELLIEIINTDEQKIIDESKSILKKLLRLVQIASNPGLVVVGYKEIPSKFKELDKLVKEIIDLGEKVIIWSSFVDNVKTLRRRYEEFGAVHISGEVEISRRNKYVQMFQEDPDCKIMVANPAAAREGLTLTAANTVLSGDTAHTRAPLCRAG